MLKSTIIYMCIVVFALLLSCQHPNDAGNNNVAVLQKTDFIVRSTDYPNFCKNICDSTTMAYRNSDTLRIAVRQVDGCPPYSLYYQIKNDTLLLTFSKLGFTCVDTLRYTYLEYGFKIQSDGKIRIIAEDSTGTHKCVDTLINTKDVTKNYVCE